MQELAPGVLALVAAHRAESLLPILHFQAESAGPHLKYACAQASRTSCLESIVSSLTLLL